MTQPKGWHSRGYLPHFDSAETIQFVTFRLADSLPRHVIESLRLPEESLQAFDQELDAGRGACWLRKPEIASLGVPMRNLVVPAAFGTPTTSIDICAVKII